VKRIAIVVPCVFCQGKNKFAFRKPTPGSPATENKNCEYCDSRMLVSVRKELGAGPNGYTYDVVETEPTANGVIKFNEHQAKLQAEAEAAAPAIVDDLPPAKLQPPATNPELI
jgi:DNA-directed RNA polymerase subunit RPC12/RpoP